MSDNPTELAYPTEIGDLVDLTYLYDEGMFDKFILSFKDKEAANRFITHFFALVDIYDGSPELDSEALYRGPDRYSKDGRIILSLPWEDKRSGDFWMEIYELVLQLYNEKRWEKWLSCAEFREPMESN